MCKGKEKVNVKKVVLPHCEIITNWMRVKLGVLGELVEIMLHKGTFALQQLPLLSTNSSQPCTSRGPVGTDFLCTGLSSLAGFAAPSKPCDPVFTLLPVPKWGDLKLAQLGLSCMQFLWCRHAPGCLKVGKTQTNMLKVVTRWQGSTTLHDGPFSTLFLKLTLPEGEEVKKKFVHFIILLLLFQSQSPTSSAEGKSSSVAQRKSDPSDSKLQWHGGISMAAETCWILSFLMNALLLGLGDGGAV